MRSDSVTKGMPYPWYHLNSELLLLSADTRPREYPPPCNVGAYAEIYLANAVLSGA